MPTSERVANGSKTRGSTSTPIGRDSLSGNEFDEQRQGVDLSSVMDQSTSLAIKIRSNSDEIKTIAGRDLSEIIFDDSVSSDAVGNGTSNSIISLGGLGKIDTRFSHRLERRDLGQSHLYDDSMAYFDTQDINPSHIVKTRPFFVELPPALADHNSMSAMDGVIDIFDYRDQISRCSLEAPFFSRGLKGTVGQIEDHYRNSAEISTGTDINSQKITESFLDAEEYMGLIVSKNFKGVSLQAIQSDVFSTISPHEDLSSDRQEFYKKSSLDSEMKHELIMSRSLGVNHYDLNKKFNTIGFLKNIDLSNGLQLWTRFKSGLALDFSPNSRNQGLINSPVSRLNQNVGATKSYDALEFNGANSGGNGVNIGAADLWDALIGNNTGLGSTQQMTFSFWINKTGHGGSNFGRLIAFGSRDIEIYTNSNNTLFFGAKWNGGTDANHRVSWNTPTGALSLNKWTHIAVTYDAVNTASSAFFYVNGVKYVDNTPDPADETAPNNGITGPFFGIDGEDCIIGNNAGLNRTFEGMIAEVGIWNRVLTHEEILALYRASKFGTNLLSPNTLSLNNYLTNDKMSLTGYRYESNNTGVDSIAFGGLLK